MLRAVGLTCSKKDRLLFSDLNLQLQSGQILHIVGENGSGKTSLLRILVGLATANSGEVSFDDTPLADSYDFLSQLIFIGHKSGNSGQLNALQNLTFWCAQQGIEVGQADVFDLLAKLGLVGLEEQKLAQLSAGQQRRVALARLWLKPAKLWVLDEPYTALDTSVIALLNSKIEQHVQSGGGVILTSHQTPQIAHLIQTLPLEYLL